MYQCTHLFIHTDVWIDMYLHTHIHIYALYYLHVHLSLFLVLTLALALVLALAHPVFESKTHYQETQSQIVMSSRYICQLSLCRIHIGSSNWDWMKTLMINFLMMVITCSYIWCLTECLSELKRVASWHSVSQRVAARCSGHSYMGSGWI